MTAENQSPKGENEPLSSYEIPHADPSLASQLTGARVLGFLLSRNSLPETYKDNRMVDLIQNDSRLSDAFAQGAEIGSEEKKLGR